MQYSLPKNVVAAKSGDHIMRRKKEGDFEVFKVDGIYLLSKLMLLSSEKIAFETPTFIDEKSVAASNPPDIRYRVTSFKNTFANKTGATKAIKDDSLGTATPERFIEVEYFLKENSAVILK